MSDFEKIEKLWKEYAAHYESWESLEPYANALFHDELTVNNGNGELSRVDVINSVKTMIAKKTTIRNFEIYKTEGDNIIYYTAAITVEGQPTTHPRSKGIIKDGKLWRVETDANYLKK